MHRHERLGVLLLIPIVLIFCALVWVPLLANFILSFVDWDILSPAKWIGFGNFLRLLRDSSFWRYAGNTFYLTLGKAIPLFFISLLVAVLVRKSSKRVELILGLLFMIPIALVVCSSTVYLTWRWLYNPDFGLINFLLDLIGIKGPQWLASTVWAKPALILMTLIQYTPVWVGLGLIFYLAAWRGELRNSASHSFRFVIVLMAIWTIVSYLESSSVYIMTGGGPKGATTNIIYYAYNNTFQWFKIGYGATINGILIAFSLVLGIVLWKISEKWSIRITFQEGPGENRNSERKSRRVVTTLAVISVFLATAPFMWAFATSVKEAADVFIYPVQFLPESFCWKNYAEAWQAGHFGKMFVHALLRLIFLPLLHISIAFLTAYCLSVLKPPGRRAVSFAIISTMFIGGQVYFLTWLFLRKVGIHEGLFAQTVPYLAWGWGVFLFKLFFDGLEKKVKHARLRKMSEWSIFKAEVLPASWPMIALMAIIFSFPFCYYGSVRGNITSFASHHITNWPLLMAGGLIAAIPGIIILLVCLWILWVYVLRRLVILSGEDISKP